MSRSLVSPTRAGPQVAAAHASVTEVESGGLLPLSIVPLGAAHAAGGHAWDAERRRAFANDLAVAHHLIAVKASANRSKGKPGPDEWLPSLKGYRCNYVKQWITIKARWGLSVAKAEKRKISKLSAGCLGPVHEAQSAVPPRPESVCERFNRDRRNALSRAEHVAQFGCPPCPCSCNNGKITCAPCAMCRPGPESLKVPAP